MLNGIYVKERPAKQTQCGLGPGITCTDVSVVEEKSTVIFPIYSITFPSAGKLRVYSW